MRPHTSDRRMSLTVLSESILKDRVTTSSFTPRRSKIPRKVTGVVGLGTKKYVENQGCTTEAIRKLTGQGEESGGGMPSVNASKTRCWCRACMSSTSARCIAVGGPGRGGRGRGYRAGSCLVTSGTNPSRITEEQYSSPIRSSHLDCIIRKRPPGTGAGSGEPSSKTGDKSIGGSTGKPR